MKLIRPTSRCIPRSTCRPRLEGWGWQRVFRDAGFGHLEQGFRDLRCVGCRILVFLIGIEGFLKIYFGISGFHALIKKKRDSAWIYGLFGDLVISTFSWDFGGTSGSAPPPP